YRQWRFSDAWSCRLAAKPIIGPAIRKVLEVGQQDGSAPTSRTHGWFPEATLGSVMSRCAPARRRPPAPGEAEVPSPSLRLPASKRWTDFGEVNRVSLRQFTGGLPSVAQNSA